MLPTVARVLDLDVMRRGLPQVVAGADQLERLVRWVHVSELHDVAGVLQGGELVLTTGIALPEDRDGLARYVRELVEVGAAGLVVEFGRRYFDSLPRALVHAAEQRGLPVIVLRRELRFVAITEAVHALVVNAQLEQLRASEAVHQVFNELAVEGAEPNEVLRQIARMASAPVVLENLSHQVLAHDSAGSPENELLEDWERRSRGVRPTGRTGYDPRSGWLVTTVGARGQDWGRLVLVNEPGGRADNGQEGPLAMLLERGAATLALNRLLVRDRESLERQTHRTLLSGILTHALTVSEVALRAQALGVPLEGRRLVGVVLRQRGGLIPAALEAQSRLRDFTELAATAARSCRLAALVGALDDDGVGLLVALGSQQDEHTALEGFAAALRKLSADSGKADTGRGDSGREAPSREVAEPVIAVGSSVGSVRDARRTLMEGHPGRRRGAARRAGRAGILVLPPAGRPTARPAAPVARDARLQTYVERELGPLLAHDAEHGSQLVPLLRVYLEQGRNKSAAADAAHLSRPSFYDRLHKVERILAVDLDQVESCLSLHVALLALDAVRR